MPPFLCAKADEPLFCFGAQVANATENELSSVVAIDSQIAAAGGDQLGGGKGLRPHKPYGQTVYLKEWNVGRSDEVMRQLGVD